MFNTNQKPLTYAVKGLRVKSPNLHGIDRMNRTLTGLIATFVSLCALTAANAAEPLHVRIDAAILRAAKSKPAPPATDAEFVRRVYLDFAGRIPSADETRRFLADQSSDKRTRLIDELLASPEYARRMAELFHAMLMERRGEQPEWSKYLRAAFEANKPWDQMAREILAPNADDEVLRGTAFFYTKRLDKVGEQPVDYPGLTRDIGRLFLGMDVQCAQCHDHPHIDEYKQVDFQGLFAFVGQTFIRRDTKFPAVGEKPLTKKLEYMSVFIKEKEETGPRVPRMAEVSIPEFKKGEEFAKPPDRKINFDGEPKFRTLASLAEQLPVAENANFARNAVNRLWFVLMGRGLVHPLDLNHDGNAPSHPELLDLLAQEFVAAKFDIKWFVRELALTETYQRSSLEPGREGQHSPESFLIAQERPLSTEQLLWSMFLATQNRKPDEAATDAEKLLPKFLKAFAGPAAIPEIEFAPSVKSALFVLNDSTVLGWLEPQKGNLVERLLKLDQADALAEELYITVLSRLPTEEEKTEVADYLATHSNARNKAIGHLVWALLASTEFSVNH